MEERELDRGTRIIVAAGVFALLAAANHYLAWGLAGAYDRQLLALAFVTVGIAIFRFETPEAMDAMEAKHENRRQREQEEYDKPRQ